MKGTILQPTFLPWMGYFQLIDMAELFVVFDHVQFVKKSFHHRNKIKTSAGLTLLSVPTKKAPRSTPISEIEIAYDRGNVQAKHWKTIEQAYKNTPYFSDYKLRLEEIFENDFRLLRDLNVSLIQSICDILGIETRFQYSSLLGLEESDLNTTEKVVNLCQKVGIDYLHDTAGAEEVLETSLFAPAKIEVEYQSFEHPVYRQQYGEFISHMCVLDLIFNVGSEALTLIRGEQKLNSL